MILAAVMLALAVTSASACRKTEPQYLFEVNGKCYDFVSYKSTYAEAVEFCTAAAVPHKFPGYESLVAFGTGAENVDTLGKIIEASPMAKDYSGDVWAGKDGSTCFSMTPGGDG